MFNDLFDGKKVLVTGHTGFKGSWLSQWLLELGADVTGLSISIPSEPSHFDVLGLSARLKDYRVDINNESAVLDVFKTAQPEIVFHLAAQPIVSTSIANPVENFTTNVLGTVHVLEAIRKTKSVQSAVVVTSDKCYENVEWEFGYRESDRLGGKDPYSASKACSELVFHSYFRTYFKDMPHLQIATARAGNVIGGGDWAKDRIVPDNAKAWGANKEPVIRSPHSTRPWQHVLEPLSGYIWLAAKLFSKAPNLNGESFNFGPQSDVLINVEQLLTAMVKHWPKKTWRVEKSVLAQKEAGLLKLCCDKALSRLEWRPTLEFSETVEFTASWYRNYYESSSGSVAKMTTDQISRYVALATTRHQAWVGKSRNEH